MLDFLIFRPIAWINARAKAGPRMANFPMANCWRCDEWSKFDRVYKR